MVCATLSIHGVGRNRVPLLAVENLSLEFQTRSGIVHALEDVGFSVEIGEIVGLVGESGSGKSVTAYAIMGILEAAARVKAGRIKFGELDILTASETELRSIRGHEISMVFQNPRGALNPIRTIGRQIADVIDCHHKVGMGGVNERVIAALSTVRIPDPARRAEVYPYEMSGGMCQRVGIALAMSCQPKLLIADEPTTGLDVTTQATIMDLLRDIVRAGNMALVLITHDLRLAMEYCDRIVVMHAGHVVEIASTTEIFTHPRHPYTAALIASTPSEETRLDALSPIEGGLPDLRRQLPPCRFSERCARRIDKCVTEPLRRIEENGHMVACWRPS